MIHRNSKVYIAGHNGMVGSSLLRLFIKKKFSNILIRKKNQLDLLDQNKTFNFLKYQRPDAVIIAAAKVGGIKANNNFRADFLYENIQIQNNLIHGSFLAGVKKVIFLGSSCIYPRDCKQPIKEKYLLSSPLEKTNEPYAIAKISGVKMIENYNRQYNTNYLSLMPCNLYGPNDNYDIENSHFLPAIIKKMHYAKKNNEESILLWGNGKPKRELMHVDDLAEACYFFLRRNINLDYVNIGSGKEMTIKKYAKLVSQVVGYNGKILFNNSSLNGTPRKILDSNLANKLGWRSKISINNGLRNTYKNFLYLYDS